MRTENPNNLSPIPTLLPNFLLSLDDEIPHSCPSCRKVLSEIERMHISQRETLGNRSFSVLPPAHSCDDCERQQYTIQPTGQKNTHQEVLPMFENPLNPLAFTPSTPEPTPLWQQSLTTELNQHSLSPLALAPLPPEPVSNIGLTAQEQPFDIRLDRLHEHTFPELHGGSQLGANLRLDNLTTGQSSLIGTFELNTSGFQF